jgi:hypothetical protein
LHLETVIVKHPHFVGSCTPLPTFPHDQISNSNLVLFPPTLVACLVEADRPTGREKRKERKKEKRTKKTKSKKKKGNK